MVTPINTDVGSVFYDAPNATVAIAETLGGEFIVQARLRVDRLRVTIAPDVGEASLAYEYGNRLHEDATAFAAVPPLDLLGKYCRVTIPDTVGTDDLVWYGVVEADDRETFGTHGGTVPTGLQRFTAYGLLRLFERVRVTSAVVRQTVPEDPLADETRTIGRGLSFNRDQQGRFLERSNRDGTIHDAGEAGSAYVFSDEPSGQFSWTAWQAVQHLLVFHPPADAAGERLCEVALAGDEDSLSWYDVGIDTDGKTAKQLLDQLIDRRRGVGYRVDFSEATAEVLDPPTPAEPAKLTLKVFTFADAAINLPSGGTLAANPDQYSLDFEAAFDIEQAIVSNLAVTKYDKVITRGEYKTTTLTMALTADDNLFGFGIQIVAAWDDADRDRYLEAASQTEGYSDLDLADRSRLNAITRASDELAHVFRRFVISPEWEGWTIDCLGNVAGTFYAQPVFDANGDPLNTGDPALDSKPIWNRGLRIERFLPLRDRRDYSGTAISEGTYEDGLFESGRSEYLRPFFFTNIGIHSSDIVGNHFVTIDQLTATVGHEKEGRRWSADLKILDAGPQIEIAVQGGPQHMLFPDEMINVEYSSNSTSSGNVGVSGDGFVGVFDPEDDPSFWGIPYFEIIGTVCLRLDSRVEGEYQISEPPAGQQERILAIDVPDARLDYVVPYTVVGCALGGLVQTTTGGHVRDDRNRLADIARAAAEWYGRDRQALRLKWRQCRKLLEPGWLITDIGSNYNITGVNSIVSAVTYTLTEGSVSTEIETAFASLDLM